MRASLDNENFLFLSFSLSSFSRETFIDRRPDPKPTLNDRPGVSWTLLLLDDFVPLPKGSKLRKERKDADFPDPAVWFEPVGEVGEAATAARIEVGLKVVLGRPDVDVDTEACVVLAPDRRTENEGKVRFGRAEGGILGRGDWPDAMHLDQSIKEDSRPGPSCNPDSKNKTQGWEYHSVFYSCDRGLAIDAISHITLADLFFLPYVLPPGLV